MDKEVIFTVIIPVLLIGVLVYYNLRKMRNKAQEMEQNHTVTGCSGCSGCAHKDLCTSSNKEEDVKEES